jgi:hydrogenase/urease accessory protein HupE
MKRLALTLLVLVLGSSAAFAHPGHGSAASFTAGIAHPLSGLDHGIGMCDQARDLTLGRNPIEVTDW